jgi:hypothetical protein
VGRERDLCPSLCCVPVFLWVEGERREGKIEGWCRGDVSLTVDNNHAIKSNQSELRTGGGNVVVILSFSLSLFLLRALSRWMDGRGSTELTGEITKKQTTQSSSLSFALCFLLMLGDMPSVHRRKHVVHVITRARRGIVSKSAGGKGLGRRHTKCCEDLDHQACPVSGSLLAGRASALDAKSPPIVPG